MAPENAPSDEPHEERVQTEAQRRRHERTERVEEIVTQEEWNLEALDYPVSSEGLATEYGDQPLDLPNETETLGDVFDRLVGETYDSPAEVREAVYGGLTGRPGAGGPEEYNAGRDLEQLDEADDEESNVNWQ